MNSPLLTFEPWNGGFNNVRMSLELAYALAYMDSRTLVLPPKHVITFHHRQTVLSDFFKIDGVETVAFDEFRESWPRRARLTTPSRRINWGASSAEIRRPWDGIEEIAVLNYLNPLRTVYCFPRPSAPAESFRQFLNGRTAVEGLGVPHETEVVHFPQTLFGQFYTMIYSEDPGGVRRKVRDGLRYHDWIEQAARRIIAALGPFSSMHVRRGDFSRQYPGQVAPVDEIARNIEKVFDAGETIYVATDEAASLRSGSLADRYRLKFAGDFLHLLPDRSHEAEFLPLIEQIVCAHGKTFVGTEYSTMSSYIFRLRGYYGQTNREYYVVSQMNSPGAPELQAPSWYWSVSPRLEWTREFKEAWEC